MGFVRRRTHGADGATFSALGNCGSDGCGSHGLCGVYCCLWYRRGFGAQYPGSDERHKQHPW